MKTLLGLLSFALVSSCAATTGYPVAIKASDAVIWASPDNHENARQSLETVRLYLPVVQAILGAECAPPSIVLLDHELPGNEAGYTLSGSAGPEDIYLGLDGQSALRPVLVHELVHWVIFSSVWKHLPPNAHEGLAYLLQLQLVEAPGKAITARPPADVIAAKRALADIDEWSAQLYLTGKIGLSGLRELAERAAREGLETVPDSWLTEETFLEPSVIPPLLLWKETFRNEKGEFLRSRIRSEPLEACGTADSSYSVEPYEFPHYDGPLVLMRGAQARTASREEMQTPGS